MTGPAEHHRESHPADGSDSFAVDANLHLQIRTPGQQVQFTYNLALAEAADTLTITDGTIPGTDDLPVDPTTFQSVYVPNTSFATSSCLIHTGELSTANPPANCLH